MNFQKHIIRYLVFLLLFAVALPLQALATEDTIDDGVDVPIIMYHSLNKKRKDSWTLQPSAFEQDLRYLQDNGYTSVLLTDLVDYVENGTPLPEKPIVITFDDCYYNNLVYAFPLLEQYDMKMVLSVIGSYSQEFSEAEDLNPDYAHLSWTQLREMQDSGRVELANHTWGLHTHKGGRDGCCRLQGENMDSYRLLLYNDVSRLQNTLQEQCGIEPIGFTYPFGSKCPEALALLKELGFKVTLSCYEGMNHVTPNSPDCLFDMHRINRTPAKSVQSILQKFTNYN